MDRAQKNALVTKLNEVFSTTSVVVVAHYSGLTVAQMSDLRIRMGEAGAHVKVAKNRLVKLALEGTDAVVTKDLFQGQTVIAYSDDPVAAPKVAMAFAKDNEKFIVLGGSMGAMALDNDGIKALAALPSLDELRGKIVGMISTPATRIAQVINAPAGQMARVVGAYAEKSEAA